MKWSGNIGYVTTAESPAGSGIYKPVTIEKFAIGDVLQRNSKWENTQNQNDNIIISNRISLVADQYAYANFSHIRYLSYMGVNWEVVNIDVQHPRLILTLGGVYNG